MKPKEVSRKVSSMRARFQKMLPAVAVLALLAVGAYFVFRTRLGPDDQAQHQQPSATPAPSAPPGPSPEQLAEQQRQADDLRQLAVADCTAGHWDSCVRVSMAPQRSTRRATRRAACSACAAERRAARSRTGSRAS